MTNNIKKRQSKFTQVSNSFLRDNNISFKAKGLFCYMFSMSEDWNFTIKSIATQQKDGEASIISAMNELKQYGYITYTKHNNGSGTYFLNDEPNLENPNVENPNLGKPTCIKKKQLDKNKNSKFDSFLEELKAKVSIKSKVTKTKDGEKLFKQIEDKEKLMNDYIKHQLDKKEFAQRITAYMMDYNTVYKQEEKRDNVLCDEWGNEL
jgi:hypothetical protein